MNIKWRILIVGTISLISAAPLLLADEPKAVPLPQGVAAVWDSSKAFHEATSTRERVCLNGLWRWQPGNNAAQAVPTGGWGYFKVPGCWPGITDYMQKECQTVHRDTSWKDVGLGGITTAWYERRVDIPADWVGRRISLQIQYLNSHAVVYVDGKSAGEIHFPAGEVDLTAMCRPGGAHTLSLHVTAMPLKGVLLSYTDSASAREVKGGVARRGLCGDVYLVATPAAARINDVSVDTSVRNWQITFATSVGGLAADGQYMLRARIEKGGKAVQEFQGSVFRGSEIRDGRASFSAKWKPDKLWDLHTPGHMYELHLSLLDGAGSVLDTSWPVRFGFREFWIDGRDFYLNGSRIYLSSVPLDNAEVSAALATYERAKESLERLKSFGINFVYTHNYGCEPGSHLSFEEILRAADDAGMLVSMSQPHFSHYDWKAPDADRSNGYARHAEFYVRLSQNHPSIVAYAMSHNATGYEEDMNPDMIDGISDPRQTWGQRNALLALRAEAIVRSMDPNRVIYHHASGNLGAMHAINYYANFAPIQEQSDWFEHWATRGVKPVFTCEYGVPFTWDWTMYRGWYKGQREFGSAKVPWEFCLAEWNSQFVGDRAFQISEAEKANLRWEAQQFRAGNLWHRWDYPASVGSSRFDERYPIFAAYITDNWRSFRTWGVSGMSPWEHEHFWKLRPGVDKNRKELSTDWEHLQRPGFSPDFEEQRYERMDLAFERSDWTPTAAAQALIRNNRALLAYIGGKPGAFTSKDHIFRGGNVFEKQLIIINNSRETISCDCDWSLGLPKPIAGSKQITLPTGQQERIPLRLDLPAALANGRYELSARVRFSNGETQTDAFFLDVVAAPAALAIKSKIAVFDPRGETVQLLKRSAIPFESVQADSDITSYDTLVVGKSALTVDGPAPDISRVSGGLKVIIFEQTADVLEKRFGFRVAQYGLRSVFHRLKGHPLLDGLDEEQLRDWRGEATILPSRLSYELRPRYGPTVQWCGISVPRLWRCGNRGNVASVLIEKPTCGDFLPILDGGYSLQYSPLLEYHEGDGMVLFCQLDVTGRTESEPATEALVANIVRYASSWKPTQRRAALYAGDSAGKAFLAAAGIGAASYEGGSLTSDRVLIVGPGGGRRLANSAPDISRWLSAGGHLLAIGLDERDASAVLPFKVATLTREHIGTYFPIFDYQSLLAGVGPADVHNRDPRDLPLISGGAMPFGDGVLANVDGFNVIFCQFVPWQFDSARQSNLKRTYRRASFVVDRLLANMGVAAPVPVLSRFHTPVDSTKAETRWLKGLYLDTPEEWDDPYRFFRW